MQEIERIKPGLESIFRQSIKPNKIYINIPNQHESELSNGKSFIPDWLKAYPNLIVNKTNNYGTITSLIGVLEKEQDPSTVIVTLEENIRYPRQIVRDLVKQYLPGTFKVNYKKGAAITGIGVNYLFDPNFNIFVIPVVVPDRPSLLVVNSGGVAYKRSFFKDDIFSFVNNLPPSCWLSGNLTISSYLIVNNISIVKIAGISYNPFSIELFFKKQIPYLNSDYLSENNNDDVDKKYVNYTHCLQSLPSYHKANYQKELLHRSKVVYSLWQHEILRNYTNRLYYACLNKIVHNLPFMEKIVIETIG